MYWGIVSLPLFGHSTHRVCVCICNLFDCRALLSNLAMNFTKLLCGAICIGAAFFFLWRRLSRRSYIYIYMCILFLQWSARVAAIMEVPFVACVPNGLVQRYALTPFRLHTGGTILVRWTFPLNDMFCSRFSGLRPWFWLCAWLTFCDGIFSL